MYNDELTASDLLISSWPLSNLPKKSKVISSKPFVILVKRLNNKYIQYVLHCGVFQFFIIRSVPHFR